MHALNQGQRGLSFKCLRIAKMFLFFLFFSSRSKKWNATNLLPHTKHLLEAIRKKKHWSSDGTQPFKETDGDFFFKFD